MPGGLQAISFTATAVSYTSHTKIAAAEPDQYGQPDRALRFFAHSASTTTGTATVRLSLCDAPSVPLATRQVYYAENCTITHSTSNPRVGIDGASGAYVCDVSFAKSSTDRVDIMGGHRRSAMCPDLEWRIGLVATALGVSTTTPLLTYISTDPAV